MPATAARSSKVCGRARFLALNHALSALTHTSPKSIAVSEPESSGFNSATLAGRFAGV